MKSEKLRTPPLIAQRSLDYALRVIELYRALEHDAVGRVLGQQLLRSGTSIGANIQEAQGAQSRADFIAKVSIAYKEARESAYWLTLIQRSRLASTVPETLQELLSETAQLIKIPSSILLTTKQGRR